jgi:hypothetical protein
MDASEKPPQAHHDFVHRAEHAAVAAEHRLPAWLQPGNPESRWPVLVALIAAIVMQRAIPERYTVVPRWPLVAMEVLLVVVLLIINPVRLTRSTTVGRVASLVLLAAITVDNTASAIVLDYHILSGTVSNDAAILLGSGAAVFITNIIVFGIWYWEVDMGGPFARLAPLEERNPNRRYPDFLFPQMDVRDAAPKEWEPRFVDYLYVSVTNVMAFSPTDTMPLTHRAKAMMTIQALVAVSTIALVFARAVNVLS